MVSLASVMDEALQSSSGEGDVKEKVEEALACPCISK
jgi:hypothetical protein